MTNALANGINVEAPESLASQPRQLTLSPTNLRKLQRLYSRADAYNEIMELSKSRTVEAQEAFSDLLTECLEEAGVATPSAVNYAINWKSGVVTLQEAAAP